MVKEAEEKLSKTPEKLSKEVMQNGYKYKTSVANPEYKEAAAEAEHAMKVLNDYKTKVSAIYKEIEKRNNEHLTAIAALGTEWQDKLASETSNIDDQQTRSLAKLNKKAEEAFGERYKKEESYLKEVEALNKFYDQKRSEELKKRAKEEIDTI